MIEEETDWRPEQMPTLAIGRLAHRIAKMNDAGLRGVGITASQLPVLVALKNGEQRTQRELARMAEVEQPSMAQLLARMERDGLIRRQPAPDDQRSSLVSLTNTALRRLEPGRDVLRTVNQAACNGFDLNELELLIGLLERITRNIGNAS